MKDNDTDSARGPLRGGLGGLPGSCPVTSIQPQLRLGASVTLHKVISPVWDMWWLFHCHCPTSDQQIHVSG